MLSFSFLANLKKKESLWFDDHPLLDNERFSSHVSRWSMPCVHAKLLILYLLYGKDWISFYYDIGNGNVKILYISLKNCSQVMGR